MEHLQLVWHASRERLPFRTPGSVPILDLANAPKLLRPNFPNLPCLYSTFHLEYPLVVSRFCLSPHDPLMLEQGPFTSSFLFNVLVPTILKVLTDVDSASDSSKSCKSVSKSSLLLSLDSFPDPSWNFVFFASSLKKKILLVNLFSLGVYPFSGHSQIHYLQLIIHLHQISNLLKSSWPPLLVIPHFDITLHSWNLAHTTKISRGSHLCQALSTIFLRILY